MNYYSLVSAILVAQRHFAFSVHRLMENRVLLGSQPLINNQVQQKKKHYQSFFLETAGFLNYIHHSLNSQESAQKLSLALFLS